MGATSWRERLALVKKRFVCRGCGRTNRTHAGAKSREMGLCHRCYRGILCRVCERNLKERRGEARCVKCALGIDDFRHAWPSLNRGSTNVAPPATGERVREH